MVKDSISEFLNAVFPMGELPDDHQVVLTRMVQVERDGVKEEVMSNFTANARNVGRCKPGEETLYFCFSTAVKQEDGKARRRAVDLREAYVIVFDDIGTKAAVPPVEPSYILQTSIKNGVANYQYGYLIEAFDVSSAERRAYFDGVLLAASKAGFNDPGMRSAGRIARLPGALHKSGFVAELVKMDANRVFVLEDLVAELGLDVVVDDTVRDLAAGTANLDNCNDQVLDWLLDAGLVEGGATGDFINVTCPWHEEHTDGRTAAGYSPENFGKEGRQFKCLHGHCSHRKTGDFLAWVAEQGGPDVTARFVPTEEMKAALRDVLEGQRDVLEETLAQFVYLENQRSWLSTATGHIHTSDSLQVMCGSLVPRSKSGKPARAADLWAQRKNALIVSDTLWSPVLPVGLCEFQGRKAWNTYTPRRLEGVYDADCAQVFEQHIMDTFGGAGAILMRWMGWVAQNPAQKVKWGVLLHGMEGDGKSILGNALALAIEEGHYSIVSTSTISSERNSYADEKRLVVLEEIRLSGTNRHATLDKLKDLVTNDTVEIRTVYRAPKTVPNYANVMGMTNHADALPVNGGDRRWGIFSSRFRTRRELLEERGEGSGYFDKMWYYIKFEPQKVVGWLLSIDTVGFNPSGHAPHTDAKDEMRFACKDEHTIEMFDIIEASDTPWIHKDVFAAKYLKSRLAVHDLRSNGHNKALMDEGWKLCETTVKVQGQVVRVWYKPAAFASETHLTTALARTLESHNSRCCAVPQK